MSSDRDLIGVGGVADEDAYDDEAYDDDRDGGTGVVRAVATAPESLALAALILSAVSILGLGLLNGSPYVTALYAPSGGLGRGLAVASSVLGAALALLPAALGVVALRRLPEASTFRAIAGSAVLVALLSVLLRLALAVLTSLNDAAQFSQF